MNTVDKIGLVMMLLALGTESDDGSVAVLIFIIGALLFVL